ncbi:MAG: hypothetical protein K6E98_13405 [Lachnospiraceae bacterium]|nr:hypothetical protein [Lachnospiraceae bacterium]
MAKPGKKKKSCEKYKQENHLEKNKEKKQLKNEMRIEKFRKRRERKENGEIVKEEKAFPFNESNVNSNKARHTEFSRLRSIFAKVHAEVMKQKMEMARLEYEILKNENYNDYLDS